MADEQGGPVERTTPETLEERHWRDEAKRLRELVERLDRSSDELASKLDQVTADRDVLRLALRGLMLDLRSKAGIIAELIGEP